MADLTPFPVDLDAEAIFVDGNWYTREDLARRIKAMLDQGDFAVARPSSALEQLTHALHSVRTLAFRAPADLADAIAQIASRSGVSVAQVLREAAMGMVMASRADRREDTARVPISQPPAGPVVTPAPVIADPPGAIVAGPGALRNAGVTAEDKPVELTNPKKPNEETSAEHRWFKQ